MNSEDSIIFCQDGYTSQSFRTFTDMRQKEELVDFKITFENRSITGHRLVLAARIPYFRKIFHSPEDDEVALSEIDPDTLEMVIDFAYSGRIKITLENVESLLSTCEVLRLTQMRDACWEFVQKRLHSMNVSGIRKFAEDGCPQYLQIVDNYIKQNFEEFANSESFLSFPYQQLKEVISRDDIKVSTEEKVFEAIIRWVKNSPSEPQDLFPELLSAVRMSFLTPDYLIERVSTEDLVRSSKLCRDLVEGAKNFHLLPNKKRSELCQLPPRPRIYQMYYSLLPGNTPLRNLYAVAYSACQVNVKLLNCKSHTWSDISTCSVREVEAVAELNGMIFIFSASSILAFLLKTRSWKTFKNSRNMSVSSSGVVAFYSRIFFFGGVENNSRSVRCFEPSSLMWHDVDSMTRHLHNPGVASLGESIYITGGMFGRKSTEVVEKYNPQNRKWKVLSPMNMARYNHGCCTLNGNIYVCGGFFNEKQILASVEVYHPRANQWINISIMTEPIYKVSVVTNSGRICAIGRRDKHSVRTSHIMVYDLYDSKWTDDVPIPGGKELTTYLVCSEVK